MTYIELLKTFYEEYSEVVYEIDTIRENIVRTGTYKTNNMGGRSSGLNYRFEVCSTDVRFMVNTGVNSWDSEFLCLEYRVSTEHDTRRSTIFYDTPICSQIDFGASGVQECFDINVNDSTEFKTLQYPILESEYFQRLTQKELPPEEVYNYFVNQNKGALCTLMSTITDVHPMEELNELVKLKSKKTVQDLLLIINAYKGTLKK